MRRVWWIILGCLICGVFTAEETFFRSNSLGMPLAEISKYRTDEFQYVLTIEKTDGTALRTLYEDGEAVRRWRSTVLGRRRIVESFEGDTPVTVETYEEGRLIAEELFRYGSLEVRFEYRYTGDVLRKIVAYDEAGKVYEDAYVRDGTGRLLRLIRTYAAGGRDVSAYTFSGVDLVGEWHGDEEASTVFRFGSEGPMAEEKWREGALLYRSEILSYNPKRAVETDFVTGTVVERQYDESGNIVQESGTGPDGQLKVRYEYQDGKQVAKTARSPGTTERWEYVYEGDELTAERYLRDGEMIMNTVYTGENSYTEEIYREGRIFLKVYYEDEQRSKEEFIPAFGRTGGGS